MFLTDNYSANYEHAVVSDIGSWKSKIPVNDASMQYLFKGLKGQPVMVLEPNYTDGGNTLRLKIWSWSLGEQLQYPVGFDFGLFDLKQLKGNIVIAEVKKHKALLEKVQTPIDPKKTFGIVCEEIDKIENNLISGNLNEDEANRLYKKIAPPSEVQDDVNKRADAIISTVYACAVGMYADAYHLYQYGTLPLLPKLLHNMDGAEYVVPQLRDYYITLISIAQNKGILNLNDSINLELDMLDVFKRLNAPKEDCDPLKQNVRSLVFYADGAEKQKYINRLKLM